MALDKIDYNRMLSERPEETEKAALGVGKVKLEEWRYVNHNLVKREKAVVVWNRTAWDYLSEDEEAAAHSECCER